MGLLRNELVKKTEQNTVIQNNNNNIYYSESTRMVLFIILSNILNKFKYKYNDYDRNMLINQIRLDLLNKKLEQFNDILLFIEKSSSINKETYEMGFDSIKEEMPEIFGIVSLLISRHEQVKRISSYQYHKILILLNFINDIKENFSKNINKKEIKEIYINLENELTKEINILLKE